MVYTQCRCRIMSLNYHKNIHLMYVLILLNTLTVTNKSALRATGPLTWDLFTKLIREIITIPATLVMCHSESNIRFPKFNSMWTTGLGEVVLRRFPYIILQRRYRFWTPDAWFEHSLKLNLLLYMIIRAV